MAGVRSSVGQVDALWYKAWLVCNECVQVRTYEGSKVWRRRHYRVRRAEVPGTFRFSVLDNGVTSNEFWRSGSSPVPCCVLSR